MTHPIIAPEYVPWILKEYQHFILLLSSDQRFLGRSLAWLSRSGEMQRFSHLTGEELKELQDIMVEYENAIGALWQADHMNYLWLGNNFHEHKEHGHMHLIPRYEKPRTFAETVFTDENWGQNCFPHRDFFPPKEVLAGIVSALRAQLGPGKSS